MLAGTEVAKRAKAPYVLVAILIVVLFFVGFVNLAAPAGLLPASIIIDSLVLLAFATSVLVALRPQSDTRVELWMVGIGGLVAAYLMAAVVSPEPWAAQFLMVRSLVLYTFVSVFITNSLREPDRVRRLQDIFLWCGVAIAAFGSVQAQLASALPSWALEPRDSEVFSYFGTDIVRSNGLVGNTIVYSVLLMIVFSLLFSRLITRRSRLDLIFTVVVALGIFSTNSRAALLGAVFIALVLLVASRPSPGRAIRRSFTILAAGVAITFIAWAIPPVWTSITDSFIVQQLFLSQNLSVQGSNEGHLENIRLSIELYNEKPIFGHGLATQSADSIAATSTGRSITDGAFWSRIAEGGLVMATAYLLLFVAVVVALWRAWRDSNGTNWMSLGVLAFAIYEFGFAAFVNSGWFGKSPFLAFWIAFGLAMAARRQGDSAADVRASTGTGNASPVRRS